VTFFDVIVSLIALTVMCTGAVSAYMEAISERQQWSDMTTAVTCANNEAEYVLANGPDGEAPSDGCQVRVESGPKGWVKIEATVGHARQSLWLVYPYS
jgi:hypothetical protein